MPRKSMFYIREGERLMRKEDYKKMPPDLALTLFCIRVNGLKISMAGVELNKL